MKSFRCPQCAIAMTDDELRTGLCPICEVVVAPAQSAPAPAPKAKDPPATSGGFSVGAIAAGIIALAALCLLPFGLMVYFELLDRPATTKEADRLPTGKAKSLAEAKGPSTKSKPPLQAVGDDAKTDSGEKKIETSPKEPSAMKEPPKAVEPKKEDPKKDEPRVVKENRVQPILVDPNRRLANLRLVTDGAIKIDGDLSDWKDIAPLVLHGVERGRPVKKPVVVPKTQKAWIAYDSRGILIAVEVVDTSGSLENQPKPAMGTWSFWDNDALEVYIDTLNIRARERGEPNAHQFFAFPLGVPNDAGIGGYESRVLRRAWTIVP